MEISSKIFIAYGNDRNKSLQQEKNENNEEKLKLKHNIIDPILTNNQNIASNFANNTIMYSQVIEVLRNISKDPLHYNLANIKETINKYYCIIGRYLAKTKE